MRVLAALLAMIVALIAFTEIAQRNACKAVPSTAYCGQVLSR